MKIVIGKNIKFLREKKNIDQQTLADALNVPRSTLACWESGLRNPKLEQIVNIAEFFNKDLSIIYNDLSENTILESTDNDYKRILKDKGLMDDNEVINEENLDKLMRIVDMVENLTTKKED